MIFEGRPSSDRLGWNHLKPVRTQTPLRTGWVGFFSKLSKHGPTSDRLAWIHLKVVRTQTHFGQVILESSETVRTQTHFGQVSLDSSGSCPNTGPLRTSWLGFIRKLSEHRPTSDKLAWIHPEVVRTQTHFGQVILESSQSCPKADLLGQIDPEHPASISLYLKSTVLRFTPFQLQAETLES